MRGRTMTGSAHACHAQHMAFAFPFTLRRLTVHTGGHWASCTPERSFVSRVLSSKAGSDKPGMRVSVSWGANTGPRHASTLETQAHVACCFLPQESPAGQRALRVTGAQQGSVSLETGHSGTIRTGFLLKAGGLALRWEPRPAGCCRRNPEARESGHRKATSASVPGASSCPQSSEFSAK